MKLIVLSVILLGYFFEVNTELAFKKVFDDLHKLPPPLKIDSRSIVETKWIEQRLDNFNNSDTRTWSMRYMENSNYFKDGSPIFIFVGGEWEIDPGFIQGGHMFDIAKELNGYMFYTEHRYYGASQPTPDLSIENLKYLDVDQALADLAHFIRTIKKTIPGLKDSKVILVGGSYSATMVTWFRKMYPELAVGAWASSAPVLAKIDFLEYKEITGQSIKIVGGQDCYGRIKRAVRRMENMLKNNKYDKLKKIFLACNNLDLDNQLDVWSLFSSLSNIFAGVVQNHNTGDIEYVCEKIMAEDNDVAGVSALLKDYFGDPPFCIDYSYKSSVKQLSFIQHTNSPSNTGDIEYVCEKIMAEDNDVAGVSALLKDYFGDPPFCIDYSYKSSVKQLSFIQHTNSPMRQWIYQTCTEYGWYQTSTSKAQPFGTMFPVDLYLEMCKDVYGDRYTSDFIHQNANKTNLKYGGMNPEVTNVYFTHGQLDPWRAMGIQKDLNQYSEATVVPLYAHCQDLSSLDEAGDTNEMTALKKTVKEHIYQWLGIKK